MTKTFKPIKIRRHWPPIFHKQNLSPHHPSPEHMLHTITVTWTSDGTNSIQSHILIEQSSCTITGLTLDTVYTITVIADNICGQGPEYSTSVSFPTGMYLIISITISEYLHACV